MAKSIDVKIDKRTFTLRGEDEGLISLAAEEVDSQIKTLKASGTIDSPEMLSILAAINTAEKHFQIVRQKTADEEYIIQQIEEIANNMSDLIEPGEKNI